MIQNFILGCLLGGVRLCLLEAEDDSLTRMDAIFAEAELNSALGFDGFGAVEYESIPLEEFVF